MNIEDYGVWFTILNRDSDAIANAIDSIYIESPDAEILSVQARELGCAILVSKNGVSWALAENVAESTEWRFNRARVPFGGYVSGVSIGMETKYDPMTVREMLENIRPWIFR
jgi:hypothetical protein